jgi:hypothetical protein
VKLGYALLLGRRCAIAAISAAGVSIMAAPASAAALPPGCSQSGQIVSCTQTFTSGSNPFTVPSGVSSLGVKAVGGQGGGAGGAFGAVVTGELPVTPGATIYAVVAANGDGGGGNGGGPAGGGSSTGTTATSRTSGETMDLGRCYWGGPERLVTHLVCSSSSRSQAASASGMASKAATSAASATVSTGNQSRTARTASCAGVRVGTAGS